MVFADRLTWIGTAVQEKGYHCWGTSAIKGDDGTASYVLKVKPTHPKTNPERQ